MARQARQNIIAPNTLYHIVCRGNNQRKIFRRTRDYQKLLKIIKETKQEHHFYLYVYSFMPNHIHLEIETQETPISKIMHRINFSYARHFHREYQTSGHLFQDRFYSSVIDKESYFWEVGRYIDLNAVRAGLVKSPEEYRWSSYSIYFQKDYNNSLIDWEKFLGYVDEDLEKARISYLEFVKEGLEGREKVSYSPPEKMI